MLSSNEPQEVQCGSHVVAVQPMSAVACFSNVDALFLLHVSKKMYQALTEKGKCSAIRSSGLGELR
jgi:hypothetical protein